MATITYSDPQPVFERKENKQSFLRMFFDAVADARMAEARLRINGHLLALDDETLAQSGIDRAKLVEQGYRSGSF